ncbi:hypothetical protein LSAT2_025467 [Lamellibrachia satsuma]|nr:hypothetical protein LSAT2_025467 [Lamellibrachia satsuma]
MRELSCVAVAWKKGQNKCYILTDKTKLSNRQASSDTDLYVMTRRCPLQQCKPDTCYNGGTCRPATSGYIFIICDCPPGYWGWWCKQALPDRPPLTTVEDIIPLFSTFPSDVHRTDVDLTDETATTGSQTSPWLPLFIALGIVAMVVLPLGAFLVYNQLNKKKGMVGEERRPSERRKSSEGRRPSERRKSSQGPSEKCDVVEDATE